MQLQVLMIWYGIISFSFIFMEKKAYEHRNIEKDKYIYKIFIFLISLFRTVK